MYGIEFKDSSAYILMNILNTALSKIGDSNENDVYVIVPEGTIYDEKNDKIIKESEFGDRIIEYTDALYGEKASYKDAERN